MISHIGRAALLVLGVTSLVLACTDEAEEQRKAAAAQEAAAQDQFTTSYCEIATLCCNRALELPKDVPACKTRVAAVDPMMIKDAQARTDCLAQLRASTPRPDFCTEFGNVEQPACPDPNRKALVGTKKVGEACVGDAECAPAYDVAVTCAGGVCQGTRRGKEGDGPCTKTLDGDVESPVEAATGPEAYVCFTYDGLICDPTAKKCIKPLPTGVPCSDSRQCAVGTFCEEREKQCFKRVATGRACTQTDECEGFCKDETCVPAPVEGEACEVKAPCAKGLQCTNGTCAKPGEDKRLAAVCTD